MAEPFTLSLIWLGQAAVGAVVGRLAERGVDRLLDGRRRTVIVPETPATPARHRLGDVTSDVDIIVRHTHAVRRSVLLAFQTAPREGERPQGVTVPMVLGETANLTLPRDDYLISALVLDRPAELGGKPTLHGVGWVRHWVASTGTDQLTITTTAPTKELLEKLGLQAQDGSSPFELAPPSAPRQLSGVTGTALAARISAQAAANQPTAAPARGQCRAATSPSGPRCTNLVVMLAVTHRLCLSHLIARQQGATVYDWSSRRPIT